MEAKTIVTQEEIDELNTVIQLKPHERVVQFTNVQSDGEGGELVSLDELYEKTGQESITKFIDGFLSLINTKKLTKAQGQLARIKGCESWVDVSDKFNARKGHEGFFSAIKDGFVNFIKMIIKFISGIVKWILGIIGNLFGFGPTEKQTQFLIDNSREIRAKTVNLIALLGAKEKVFDPKKYLSMLPDNLTQKQQLAFFKSKLDNNAEAIKKYTEAIPVMEESKKAVDKMAKDAVRSSDVVDRAFKDLRIKFKSKRVTAADILSLITTLENQTEYGLDLTKAHEELNKVYNAITGLELTDIEVGRHTKELSDEIKNKLETTVTFVNPKAEENAFERARELVFKSNVFYKGRNGAKEVTLGPSTIKKFDNIINLSDMELVKALNDNFQFTITETQKLQGLYLTYSNRVKDFVMVVQEIVNILNKGTTAVKNIVQWYVKIEAVVSAYITDDITKVLEAHKKWLTDAERKGLEKNDKPVYLLDLEESFNNKYDGELNIPENMGELSKALLETPQIRGAVDNFFKSIARG